MSQTTVELGDIGKDKISGFEGVVVAITTWLHACERVTLQPKEINPKTGKPVENFTLDGPQVELIEKGGYATPKVEKGEKTGGPEIAPVRAADPI